MGATTATYPEIVSTGGPHLRTVSDNIRNQAGAKVTSEVDGVSRLPAPAGADAEDEEEEGQRHEGPRGAVRRVGEGEDDQLEQARADELGEEHAGARHELGRVCAEDAGGGVGAGDGADALALEVVDGGHVVAVEDEGGGHGAEELADEVDGELAPRHAAVHAVGECHCRVEVAAGFLADVDAQHDAQSRGMSVCAVTSMTRSLIDEVTIRDVRVMNS